MAVRHALERMRQCLRSPRPGGRGGRGGPPADGRVGASPTFVVGGWAFRKVLAGVYLVAFLSLLPQVAGLSGPDGVLPVAGYLDAVARASGGWAEALWRAPTLAWLADGGLALELTAAAGAGTAVLWLAGVAPLASGAAAWLLYLSLVVAGQAFMAYQWDALLLEAGFLALFLVPPGGGRGGDRGGDGETGAAAAGLRPTPLAAGRPWLPTVVLVGWLLFRLVFESGVAKLASGDPTWWNLTALAHHFETQPIPNPVAWLAHQAPGWLHRIATAGALAVELGAPLLLLVPRRPRHLGAGLILLLQAAIFATGNYTFFNLLTAGLALLLFDDRFWAGMLGRSRAGRRLLGALSPRGNGPDARSAGGAGGGTGGPGGAGRSAEAGADAGPAVADAEGGSGDVGGGTGDFAAGAAARLAGAPVVPGRWRRLLLVPYAALTVAVGGAQVLGTAVPGSVPEAVSSVRRAVAPLRLVNGYGLFADMTTRRPEIVVEGRREGGRWRAYDFRYKPDRPAEMPPQVAPHQPRLDWQMWFGALRAMRAPERAPPRARYDRWFLRFVRALLRGSPEVVSLLDADTPFRDRPPDAIRARLVEYRFTDWAAWRATGDWWRRSPMKLYLPPVSLGPEGGLVRAR